jgi:hypothetical protein
MDGDPLRNFSYKGFWPSSVGADNDIKRMYYKYLYSPKLDEDDTILKLMLLQHICKQHQSELFIMQGYEMHWTNKMIKNINMDLNFVIENDYKQSKFYSTHDFTNSNTVPNKLYQIHLAKYINQNFLQLYGLNEKLEKFNV